MLPSVRHAALFAVLGAALVGILREPAKPHAAEAAPFRVPPGFVIEKVAGPPLVEHPVMAGFDDRGRLFVAESAGRNLKAEQLLKELPDSIKLLEDVDGQGIFTRATVFADKMTFPMGALWYDGALYACSPPSLWKLEDTTGKGVADKRTELVTKFGFIGNAADIHGPFLGPDGRLYWTDGRHGHEIKRDEKVMKGKAARIFRCRPDGRDVEVVCGGGMDDPVEMAFTPEGEPFATVDIYIGQPRRIDALIHCVEGGVFPYHPVLQEFKRTGPLLPPVADLGWVAPSGLTRYRSSALGADYRDNLFVTLFNTHAVQRHILERTGATFQTKAEDFLTSTSPDFHPTDVLEDADGSVLVIDTGGWFRIGCPTSQIARPEAKGAIYRIRRQDAPKVSDPWGTRIAWDKLEPRALTALLDDPRWAVRDRAILTLSKKPSAIEAMKNAATDGKTTAARRNAVWALTRIDTAEARAAVRPALADKDSGVRNAAAHSAGLHLDAAALAKLSDLVVNDPALPVRREAATALGRIRKPEVVPVLLQALRNPNNDRFVEHALIYALIEIANRDGTLKGLADSSPLVRKGALIALDQMDGGQLTREQVLPLLDTADPALQQAVLDVVTARPEWAGQLVDFLRQWLTRGELPEARRETLRGALLAFCKDAAVQKLVAQTMQEDKTPVASRLLLLEMMAQAPIDKLPADWTAELGKNLSSRFEPVARQAVATVRARNLKEFDELLQKLAVDTAAAAELRVAALGTVVAHLDKVDTPVFDFLQSRLDANLPPLARLAAAEALGLAKLSDAQLETLTRAVASAGALEMPHLVAAYERSRDPAVGRKLVAALDKAPGLASLTPDALQKALQNFPADVRDAGKPLFKRLEINPEQMKARLDELTPALSGGDVKRGRDVFFGKKALCSTCHQIKNEGGQIGPDLTKIGGIRTGRDLLEAIVFPSASFVRGYEPYVVATKDGKLYTGILRRQTAEAIYLVQADRSEIRVPLSQVDSFLPGKESIMPKGLEAQVTKQEFADLLAFLMALK
jgi:putative membrane-bound dehydrogenase-like protein